jgi:hypothetical protein
MPNFKCDPTNEVYVHYDYNYEAKKPIIYKVLSYNKASETYRCKLMRVQCINYEEGKWFICGEDKSSNQVQIISSEMCLSNLFIEPIVVIDKH